MRAFVLSGGANYGAQQVGALEVLLEHGLHPDMVMGVSAGALNAAWVAVNPTLAGVQELARIWREDAAAIAPPVGPLTALLRLLGGKDSLLSNDSLQQFIRRWPFADGTFGKVTQPRLYTVAEQDLYEGYWNVKVITDFFMDDGDGKHNYGLAGLDTPTTPQGTGTGDELLYRVLSDYLCFKVTRDVYIDRIQPDPVPYNDVATIYGSNFGSTQGTSVVRIWNCQKTSFVIAQTIFWSTMKIKFKVPKFGTTLSTYPKEKFIQVKVPGKPGSNHYLIKIIKP